MAGRGGFRTLGAIIVLVGTVLLVAAIFLPWYSEQVTIGGGPSETQYFYLGTPGTNGTVQYSCSGLAAGESCPSSTSYSSYGQQNTYDLNDTGLIAATAFFLLIIGAILGFVAAVLAFGRRQKPGRGGAAWGLAAVALILALIAPLVFAGALPNALSHDLPSSVRQGSGPWSSFYGSNSTTVGTSTVSESWGPSVGWYLSIVAFVVLLVGVALVRRGPPPMRAPTEFAAPGSPETTGTAGAAPLAPPTS